MKNYKRKRFERPSEQDKSKLVRSYLRARLREGYLLLTLALSVFLLVALLSYHRSDPGWSHLSSAKWVANSSGRVGAWLSDFLLYMVGYVAYSFPFMISYGAWIFFANRHWVEPKRSLKWMLWSLRLAGFFIILSAGSALASMLLPVLPNHMPYNAGGILGSVVSGHFLPVFNESGATLILIALLLFGITLFTGLSWVKVVEWTGKGVMVLAAYAINVLRNIPWQSLFHRDTRAVKEMKTARLVPELVEKVEPNFFPEAIEPVIRQKAAERVSQEFLENEFKTPRYSGSEILPTLSLLDKSAEDHSVSFNEEELRQKSREVELRLVDFGIQSKVVAVHPGPVVTRFELQLAAGTKVNRVTNLAKDLARSLSVVSVRIVEVIPGKSVIGLELPNKNRAVVTLFEVLASKPYQNARSSLSLALGMDIAGHPVIVDLAKMPHLLLAGTTGAGKSVSLNAMLLSLLYKSTPRQLRLILIDPKMLELSVYEGVPHLLTPVVTDMRDAAAALRWCVGEMERRYRLMASLGVRHILGYNAKVREAKEAGAPLLDPLIPKIEGEVVELQELPQVVVIADEFADMMVVVGKKIETLIVRLAQKARAAGIHLIFATQRPSVDVITGLIKANIPTRISFQVSSKIDSRTILDQQGAEQLLGYGDMLYLPPGTGVPVRVHGAYVSDDEVHRVVSYLKENSEPNYIEGVLEETLAAEPNAYLDVLLGEGSEDGERDSLYDEAVQAVVQSRRISVSSIQRRFKIGYNRAARIVEAMEAAGVVSAMESNGSREVLVPAIEDQD